MIGLAVITYKRFDYLIECLTSLKENNWAGADVVSVIEDDNGYNSYQQDYIKKMIPNSRLYFKQKNSGVAVAKNKALNVLLKNNCDHLFLMENDILIKDANTCKEYIEYAKENNLEHMNFALHGPLNIGNMSIYDGKTVYPHSVGAFSYYTNNCIKTVGMFDENFKNAYEHVEHTWRIANEGMTTPFWKFVDHPNSNNMLEEIPGSITNSSISARDDHKKNIDIGKQYWIKKHGTFI